MHRKLPAFIAVSASLALASCSTPPSAPEPNPAASQQAADAEMRSVKRDTYASMEKLRQGLEEYGDLKCIWEEEANSLDPANEVDCVVLQISIPVRAETAKLELETALGDSVPQGYETMVNKTKAALSDLASYREDDADGVGFSNAHDRATSALLTWDTVQ